jgi:predicted glutamine amidotransferase
MALVLLLSLPPAYVGCRIIAYIGDEPACGRKLLIETENNLPELAWNHPFLPASTHEKHWTAHESSLRNANENRDGWGVAWYQDGATFPLRYRTSKSLVTFEENATSPVFAELLDGLHNISQVTAVSESLGGFNHVQGLLGPEGIEVGRCGAETSIPGAPVASRAIFGHVRKASHAHDDIREDEAVNSHPFVFNNLLWMHNGHLFKFEAYTATLIRKLRPGVRGLMRGDVDSELAGALFCHHLEGFPARLSYSMTELRAAMRVTVAELRALSAEAALEEHLSTCPNSQLHSSTASTVMRGKQVEQAAAQCRAGAEVREVPRAAISKQPPAENAAWEHDKVHGAVAPGDNATGFHDDAGAGYQWAPSSMNFAVTDGVGLVVTRFRSAACQCPPSLYYRLGSATTCGIGIGVNPTEPCESVAADGSDNQSRMAAARGLLVASEPLQESLPGLSEWTLLGKDKMLTFHPSEGVRVECLSAKCTPDLPATVGLVESLAG